MKKIKINGSEHDIEHTTLLFSEFLNNLNQDLNDQQKFISAIRVDGTLISEVEESSYLTLSLDSLGDIEVETASPMEIAYEALDTLDVYVDRLEKMIQKTAQEYRNHQYILADEAFLKSIDGLELFIQSVGSIKLALRLGYQPQVALTEAQLFSVMNELLDAKQKCNYIQLAEVLSSELVSNLKEWKNNIFPFFKVFRNS